jgi:hypothetical protein
MTLLASKFDIVTCDPHPAALASLGLTLDVYDAAGPDAYGTPVAGSIQAGMICIMDSANSGEAIVADNDDAKTNAPCLMFIAVDGNADYDGSFTGKCTFIQGGVRIKAPYYVSTSYTIGDILTCDNTTGGSFRAAAQGESCYGVVGPLGLNSTDAVLDVIIPQGISMGHP